MLAHQSCPLLPRLPPWNSQKSLGSAELDSILGGYWVIESSFIFCERRHPKCQPMCHLHHSFAGTGHASLSIIESDLLGPRLGRARSDSHLGLLDFRPDASLCCRASLLFCRTSPISYTCLLLAPEPAPAGEVPEVRLGAQVLAESVCSTYPRCLGF